MVMVVVVVVLVLLLTMSFYMSSTRDGFLLDLTFGIHIVSDH